MNDINEKSCLKIIFPVSVETPPSPLTLTSDEETTHMSSFQFCFLHHITREKDMN